ncbi:TetR/AcrR family transcriptional regulator [Marinovum sp.]|uniref:TetR/AcrR family transcriptional regulator n=1 Tax=Marinovum sp. TaxID=2024839 RepID=UPI003A921DFD
MGTTRERRSQKSRTREALLEGARAMMLAGEPLSVAAAAERVGISKATAYRYFSDPGVMAAEAGLAVQVKSYDDIIAGARSPAEKLRAVSAYFFDLALTHEAGFRQFLARSLDAWGVEGGQLATRRGARRIAMFEAALEGTEMSKEQKARLVRALAVATGTEAMVVLLDVARADLDTARQTVTDITQALIDAYLPAEAAGHG